ncbi:MAG: nucleoside monophosphate kinase [Candidatus Latescibacterota bacterium]
MGEAARYRAVLILGAPGTGKGTQGKVIGGLPGFRHVSMGDIFRSLDRASELGRVFTQYSSQGKLVPDSFTVELWQDHMTRQVASGTFRPAEDVLILDGIPRNTAQAQALSSLVEVVVLIYLEARDVEEMVQRLRLRALQQGRQDDANEAVIRQRFREYEAETAPVLRFYPARLIYRVDAVGTPIEVLERVVAGVRQAL